MVAASAYAGPESVDQAIEFCEHLVTAAQDALPLLLLAHLEAMRERFDVAGTALTRSRAFVEERGGAPSSDWVGAAAAVEMLAGHAHAAETILADACMKLGERGDRAWLATLEAALAEAIFEQGRVDEALEHALRAREHAAPDDLTA